MVTSSRPAPSLPQPARQARERYGRAMQALIDELPRTIEAQLDSALRGGSRISMAELSVAMEAGGAFKRLHNAWLQALRQRWSQVARLDGAATARAAKPLDDLGLVDDDIVEAKIIASRIGAAATEAAGSQWNDLRLRMRRLEHSDDLAADDPLRPEAFALCLIEAWTESGLTRPMWNLVHAGVQTTFALQFKAICQQINAALAEQGISAELELRARPPQRPGTPGAPMTPAAGAAHGAASGPASLSGGYGAGGSDPRSGYAQTSFDPGRGGYGSHGGAAGAAPPGAAGQPGMAGLPARGVGAAAMAPPPTRGSYPGPRTPAPDGRYAAPRSAGALPGGAGEGAEMDGGHTTGWRAGVRPSDLARAAQETRMVTGLSPMARVRQRAQGVLGQLRRLLTDQVADYDSAAVPAPVSPPLAQALAQPDPAFAATQWLGRRTGTDTSPQPLPSVQVVAQQLRQRATELKAQAEKPSEKAIIEIVALMFQAILAEERIAPAIRVWFARLQIPVLRLALAEPDFFASVEHPARQLIDRMGACALGFDTAQVDGSRLEREIKRIVQVIEQYPETGRRVYQLVLDEFKKFLGRSLTEGGPAQQAATLAQQVEQKEALAVQYTIELRRMLATLTVGEEVREFLFRIWSDVLAIAAVRHGPQHAETLRFKQAAADVLWAVSAKPDRAERSRVVQQLPALLHTLRDGMATLALPAAEQDRQVKLINDAVMQAFVTRGDGLSHSKLQELSRSLAALEDVVTDDPEGDLWLDPGMIELMFGENSASVEVIATGGSQPAEAILQWARSLDLGTWFALDYQGSLVQLQYVWRSARGQLHLLSAGTGKSYLVQTQRLAAYLQAGLLTPVEDEALTVRATRDALARLQVQPGHLLQ